MKDEGVGSALRSTVRYVYSRYLYRLYEEFKIWTKVSSISNGTDNAIHMNYNQQRTNRFAKLCDEHGTDKGELSSVSNPYSWESHSYADFYDLIFNHRRRSIDSVLECGIGTTNTDIPNNMGEHGNPGASLRVWRDYFPNADVIGIDIDDDVMFSENRIETYCVDQTSAASIDDFLSATDVDTFDVIVDDGLHEYHANVSLFEHTIDRLSDDGVYIIEDVYYHDLGKYHDYFTEDLDSYHAKFIDLENPRRTPKRKNDRLIMITPR
jgi:SAM-dependent methyltransferase